MNENYDRLNWIVVSVEVAGQTATVSGSSLPWRCQQAAAAVAGSTSTAAKEGPGEPPLSSVPFDLACSVDAFISSRSVTVRATLQESKLSAGASRAI